MTWPYSPGSSDLPDLSSEFGKGHRHPHKNRHDFKIRLSNPDSTKSCRFWVWEEGSLPFSDEEQARFNDYGKH